MFEKYILKKQAEFESESREWEIKTFGMSLRKYISIEKTKQALEEFKKPLFIKQFFK